MSKNILTDHISHFNHRASEWWDLDGPFKTLHQINPLRLNYVQQYSALQGKRVLDVGCGGGVLSEALCKLGAHVTAIDLAKDAIEIAQQHKGQLAIDYRLASAEQLVEEGTQFDIVCCMELLEHIPEPQRFMCTLSQLTKDWCFISTINRSAFAWLGAVFMAERVLKWLPEGTHDAQLFIKPEELSDWGEDAGLSLHNTMGMIYDPINGQFRLSKDSTQINYLQAWRKLV